MYVGSGRFWFLYLPETSLEDMVGCRELIVGSDWLFGQDDEDEDGISDRWSKG